MTETLIQFRHCCNEVAENGGQFGSEQDVGILLRQDLGLHLDGIRRLIPESPFSPHPYSLVTHIIQRAVAHSPGLEIMLAIATNSWGEELWVCTRS